MRGLEPESVYSTLDSRTFVVCLKVSRVLRWWMQVPFPMDPGEETSPTLEWHELGGKRG